MTYWSFYTASKTRHAWLWKQWRSRGMPISSTWIDEAGEGETASFEDLWIRCIREVVNSQALLLYAEPDDVLKGAFVEVGAALASGLPVFVVGVQERWTFVNHPLVRTFSDLEEARRSLVIAEMKWSAAQKTGTF